MVNVILRYHVTFSASQWLLLMIPYIKEGTLPNPEGWFQWFACKIFFFFFMKIPIKIQMCFASDMRIWFLKYFAYGGIFMIGKA